MIDYNFIGNDRKPLYVCTWLSKSVPIGTSSGTGNSVGGGAGYLFYQTRDGFNFKSIDKIFEQQSTKNFLYNNISSGPPGGYDENFIL